MIGACFGDEGKGLVTDSLCIGSGRTAVVRHNGGAQAGHTVEDGGRRFVFHQLGSGSFHGADTVWADSFMPDLFKLSGELEEFTSLSGREPRVLAFPDTCPTLIDDVLINMALESSRGSSRHGSCGMGINEADNRISAGYGITLGQMKGCTLGSLERRMREIRSAYVPGRLKKLGLEPDRLGEYGEMLSDPEVIGRAALNMMRGLEKVSIIEGKEPLSGYSRIVFEGAQGLLLDSMNKEFAPHVTASRTGLDMPLRSCEKIGAKLGTAVYVIRSYVTRHGAGPLPGECGKSLLGDIGDDLTNQPNPWQGTIRYAPHQAAESLLKAVKKDLDREHRPAAWLAVTHLNETGNMVRSVAGDMSFEELCADSRFSGVFERVVPFYSGRSERLV